MELQTPFFFSLIAVRWMRNTYHSVPQMYLQRKRRKTKGNLLLWAIKGSLYALTRWKTMTFKVIQSWLAAQYSLFVQSKGIFQGSMADEGIMLWVSS